MNAKSYAYFSIAGVSANSDVAIVVEPASGDPDIYVSSSESKPSRARGHYTWKSASVGTETIRIDASASRTDGPSGTAAQHCTAGGAL